MNIFVHNSCPASIVYLVSNLSGFCLAHSLTLLTWEVRPVLALKGAKAGQKQDRGESEKSEWGGMEIASDPTRLGPTILVEHSCAICLGPVVSNSSCFRLARSSCHLL